MYLIKGGLIRTGTGGQAAYERRDILVEENRIQFIAPQIAAPEAEIIDADGFLIIPGLINSHLHSHDNFNKAWLENLPLELWMPAVRPFFSGVKHTPRQVYYRTLLGAAEMIRTGTTTVMDDVLLNSLTDECCMAAIVQAYEDIGIRAVVCPHTKNIPMDQTIPYAQEYFTEEMRQAINVPVPEESEILRFLESQIKKFNGGNKRVTVGLSASAPQRCSVPLLEGIQSLSKQYHVPVSSHMLETYVQKCTGPAFYGKSLVQYLYDLGLMDERLVLVHCNWISEDDLHLIEKCGSKAIHNPLCNLRMGSGIAPVYDMLQSLPVGIGTDNISASDCANLFESMKTGCLISKIRTPDYRHWLTAGQMIDMATVNGASCLCMEDEIGALKEGMKADLVMLDMNNAHYAMAADYDMALVYSENGSAVNTVMVDGEFILRGGRFQQFNERDLFDALKGIREDILQEHRLSRQECAEVMEVFDRCYQKCNEER